MDLSFEAMTSRVDSVFTALVYVVVFQAVLAVLGVLIRRPVRPMPIVEMMFNPLAIWLCDKLNRAGRTDFALIIRGAIVFFILFVCVAIIPMVINHLPFLYGYKEALQWVLILSPLAILPTVYQISKGFEGQGIFKNLSQSLHQNLITTDEHGLRREGAKGMVLALTDWFFVPVAIYILLDWPLVWLFVTLSLFVRVGQGNQSAFLSLFNFVYMIFKIVFSCLALPFVFVAALFSGGSQPLKIVQAVKRPRYMMLSCFAYAQNSVLGGRYQNRLGEAMQYPWIGLEGASAKLDHKAIIRMIILHGMVVVITMVSLFALVLYL